MQLRDPRGTRYPQKNQTQLAVRTANLRRLFVLIQNEFTDVARDLQR